MGLQKRFLTPFCLTFLPVKISAPSKKRLFFDISIRYDCLASWSSG